MSILVTARIAGGEFRTKLPFPNTLNLEKNVTYQTKKKEANTLKSRIVELESEMDAIRKDMRSDWQRDQAQKITDFRNALEQEFGLTNHPRVSLAQKNQLWDLAWNKANGPQYGDDSGFIGVYEEYLNLIGLLIL